MFTDVIRDIFHARFFYELVTVVGPGWSSLAMSHKAKKKKRDPRPHENSIAFGSNYFMLRVLDGTRRYETTSFFKTVFENIFSTSGFLIFPSEIVVD